MSWCCDRWRSGTLRRRPGPLLFLGHSKGELSVLRPRTDTGLVSSSLLCCAVCGGDTAESNPQTSVFWKSHSAHSLASESQPGHDAVTVTGRSTSGFLIQVTRRQPPQPAGPRGNSMVFAHETTEAHEKQQAHHTVSPPRHPNTPSHSPEPSPVPQAHAPRPTPSLRRGEVAPK